MMGARAKPRVPAPMKMDMPRPRRSRLAAAIKAAPWGWKEATPMPAAASSRASTVKLGAMPMQDMNTVVMSGLKTAKKRTR